MEKRLNILLIDDSEDEATLLESDLLESEMPAAIERIDTEAALRKSLQRDHWDILLLDYRMPELGAERALEVCKELGCKVPIIIYSGAIGETRAVELIRAGACDYVSKNSLARLLTVIRREVLEARMRREHEAARQALRESEKMLAAIAEIAQDGILMMDGERRIAYWNRAAQRMFGYPRSEALGLDVEGQFISERSREAFQTFRNALRPAASGEVTGGTAEFTVLHRSGEEIPVELSASVVQIRGGLWMVSILRDITERKRRERALRHMAGHDALTGLFNRRVFSQRLEGELQRCLRYNNPLTLLFVDLDHFKRVNDVHGHPIGDTLLLRVTERLKRGMREADLLARYGGEEFVLLLPEIAGSKAEATARRICAEMANSPFPVNEDLELPITVSIGVAWYPLHGTTAPELLDAADQAMYQAKLNGRNCVHTAVARETMERQGTHNDETQNQHGDGGP